MRACAAGGACGGEEEGEGRGRGGGDEEDEGVVVRGKEGAGKRACKRTLAISMRVAPARGNSLPTHIRASLYLEYARACKTWRAVA